jgi:hypothetical protein
MLFLDQLVAHALDLRTQYEVPKLSLRCHLKKQREAALIKARAGRRKAVPVPISVHVKVALKLAG